MSQESPIFQSFVGVDLHKHSVTLDAKDPTGQVVARLTTSTKNVEKLDAWIDALPKPLWLVVEACPFCEWFIDRYRDKVTRIDIADATELAARRGKRRKNDRNDAADISARMVRGDVPLGWIADEPTAQLRKLGRHWRRLSRMLSRAKHSMRSILNAANLKGPGDIDGSSAQRWLLSDGHRLKSVAWDCWCDLLDNIQLIERQRERLRPRIILANRQQKFTAAITLLKSVPGIDDVTACIIAAEVGPFDRFPNADALEFWAGLTANNKESAGVTRFGHITKAGSATLRWALGMASMCLCQSDGAWESRRQRIIAKRGKAIANTAMARRLLRTLFAMFRHGTTFEVKQPVDRSAAAREARKRQKASSGGKTSRQSQEVALT